MAKYEVISGMRAYGIAYKVGDTLELDPSKARDLIAMKRIVPATDAPVKKSSAKNRATGLPDVEPLPTDDLDVR